MERRRAHTDSTRSREEHLDGVDPGRHAPGSDDRHLGVGTRDVVHGPQRDGLDRRARQAAPARAEGGPAVLGVDDEAEERVDEREAGRARRQGGGGDLAEIGHVGRELHEDRELQVGVDHRRGRAGGGRRRMGEHRRPVLEIRAADVDLDRDELLTRRCEEFRRPTELLRRPAPHGCDDACAAGAQRRQVVVDPVLDARALQAHGVEHAGRGHVQPRRGVAGPLVRRQRLRRHRAETRRVALTRQLVAVAERARGGHDRVRQLEAPEVHAHVHLHRVATSTAARHHTSSRSWWSRWYSCRDRTWGSVALHSARPDATARAAATVVTQATRCAVAARRM